MRTTARYHSVTTAAARSVRARLALLATSTLTVLACGHGAPATEKTARSESRILSDVAPLLGKRMDALATLLKDGRILVTGGRNDTAVLRTTEVYAPPTNTWTTGPSTAGSYGGIYGALVTLKDGRVLAVGSRTELYDGTKWALAGTLASEFAVSYAYAFVLSDGRVIAFIGQRSGYMTVETPTSTYIYTPNSDVGTWAAGKSPARSHHGGAYVMLADGSILVVGGTDATGVGANSAERYVPSTNTWIDQGLVPEWTLASGLAVPGGAFVFGCRGSTPPCSGKEVDFYDAAANSWKSVAPTNSRHSTVDTPALPVRGVLLPSGAILVAGGDSAGDYELYDFKANTWTRTDALPKWRSRRATVLAGSDVYLIGGRQEGGTSLDTVTKYRQPQLGEPCLHGIECASGFCVEGVCCNTACTEQCASCASATAKGTCTAIVGTPVTSKPACAGTGPCGAACNGVDLAACHYPIGTTCSPSTCTGATFSESKCDGAGSCTPTASSCVPYACATATCKTTCASAVDCATGNYCDAGACKPFVAPGAACTTDSQCGTGHCVDGICCDTACGGQCEACDVAGRIGTCWPVSGKPHGARAACDAGTDLCAAKTCDGKNPVACDGFAPTTTKCSDASCTPAGFVEAGKCDGAGSCSKPTPKSCGAYGCALDGCKTSCTAAADCATGFVCNGAACVPGTGATCSSDGLSSTSKSGDVTSCGAYRCRGDGTCGTNCGSTSDCAPGYSCDPNGKTCATAPAAASEDSGGGCGTSGRKPTLVAAPVVVLTLAARALRRVRRNMGRA